MRNPNITVLMPVHGQAPFLEKAIESVLAQSIKDLELLVIFDRPNEDAISTVERYKAGDVRIRTLFSTTPGISAALNQGLAESNSALIARLDCDDVMEKNRLREQETILQDDRIVCVGSQLRIMDENGNTLRHTHYPTKPASIKSSLRIRNVVAHPSVMYRKTAISLVGGYRPEFNGAEDYDLWIRLSKIGQIVNINQPLTHYRIHENQVSVKNKETQISFDAKIRSINFARLRDRPGLFSALLINKAINSSGFKRVTRMGLATIVNPLVVTRFLKWQFIPEVLSNDK